MNHCGLSFTTPGGPLLKKTGGPSAHVKKLFQRVAPSNSASSASIAYRHGLTDALTFMSRVDTNYVGSRTDETYAVNTLPSYQLTNLRGGVEADHWSAYLFLNNIADKRAYLNDATQDAINIPAFNRIAVSQPRTMGIDLNYKF